RLPRHARSTLFPYTTLFRSARCALSAPFVARGTALWIIQPSGGTAGAVASPVPHDQRLTRCPRGVEASFVGPERMRIPSKGACLDRKSTRLNSSHVKISYAV